MNKTTTKKTRKTTMKNAASATSSASGSAPAPAARLTVGLDLGDKHHEFCILGVDGAIVKRGQIPCTRCAVEKMFAAAPPALVAMEVGTHSAWVEEVVALCGHETLVANTRKLRAISQSTHKSDTRDAEMLARLARADPALLSPIKHRDSHKQADLAILKSRDLLVRTRASLVNHCRGMVKSFGERLPSSSPEYFVRKVKQHVPEILHAALGPVLATIEDPSKRIKQYDKRIVELCRTQYPQAQRLCAPRGVGPITSLAFVLTVGNPERFPRAREVGAYLGLVPRRDQSGQSDKQLRITKAGSALVRRLLVNCAHYMLGRHGEDSDLKRWGGKLCARGGKNAKKRAAVAMARKLAVVLVRLWASQREYDPLYASRQTQAGNTQSA